MEQLRQFHQEILWAPWREEYILNGTPSDKCVFCFDRTQDKERFVLWRGEHGFVILNLYPYSNGHLLVMPMRHVSNPLELTASEWEDLRKGLTKGIQVLSETFHPEGFNAGMNLGAIAGAGVAHHLHVHLVPRWKGDTSFMTVLGQTRVLCQELSKTYDVLKPRFDLLEQGQRCEKPCV